MGSGGRMCGTLLRLLSFLAFSPLISRADQSQLEVMLAPNKLRVGVEEKILVEIQDCSVQHDITVDIIVNNFPTKTQELTRTSVTLTNAQNYQALGRITIPPESFSKEPDLKQYVSLRAEFPGKTLQHVVMVSHQSGYIFIQTDKTLYTPESTVMYRVFGLMPGLEPVEKNSTDAAIEIDIVTPEGNVANSKLVLLGSGNYSGSYLIPKIVSHGQWKVVAKFCSNPKQKFSAEFEVKEYVLPSFEVKLTPVTPFFYLDQSELVVKIKATYLFGQDMKTGIAFGVFGVKRDGKRSSFPGSVKKQRLNDKGEGVIKLKREDIDQAFANVLLECTIYVDVSVMSVGGGEMVEAQLTGIKVVKSPYKINFRKTPKYFKPGRSFDLTVEVLHPDDKPASNVRLMVDQWELEAVTRDGIAKIPLNTEHTMAQLTITVRTTDENVPEERQASATMVARPHMGNSSNFIDIVVPTGEIKLGDALPIKLDFNWREINNLDMTYLFLSRGQLIQAKRFKIRDQRQVSIPYQKVTKDLLPSFRFIAYYHKDDEVVSHSAWFEVKESCMGSLKLEPEKPSGSYLPDANFNLKITGDPGASVALVAVDKAVYVLNNKYRLTQKKVWDTVDKSDTGCTPGGGRDSMGVFYDAGLLFVSSASKTSYRQDLKCPQPSRKKRSSAIIQVRTSLMSHYTDKLQRDCCFDGMRSVPVSYSCERRSEYILDGPTCVAAFLHCCRTMTSQRPEERDESLKLARSEIDDDEYDYEDNDEIVTRTKFKESWLWSDYNLPICAEDDYNCVNGQLVHKVTLQSSITSWQFTGISLSRTHSICVADPLEVVVSKKFFVDLRLPYSAVVGEQVQITAIIHNYYEEKATVRVDLLEVEDLCSAAYKKGKYRQEITVSPESTRPLHFVVIPMTVKDFLIEVRALVKGPDKPRDGIRRKLKVVPQGVLQKSKTSILLDPARKGVGNRQQETINSRIPLSDWIPNTPTETVIFLTGIEQMSQLLENAVSGTSMGNLIEEPWGCGEQNMAAMTLPVIATTYLDKTNQWETVGFDKRDEALRHIATGYENQLPYCKSDGSFTVFKSRSGSTWLTAYVAKVFAMAYTLAGVEKHVLCDGIKFLILRTQQPDGSFVEIGYVYSSEMRSDVLGLDSDASMTAFCLIAMQESRSLCSETVTSLAGSINKAVAFLERRLPALTNPYAVAMTSYALANEGRLNKGILMNFVSSDRSHWPTSRSVYTLEATAYALLALVRAKAFNEAKPVVRWFIEQQKESGGYGSTQATIMVYQAIAEYWTYAKEPEYNLNVELQLQGKNNRRTESFTITKSNHHATKSAKVNNINSDVNVTASGKGEATLKIVSHYYAMPENADCEKFNWSVQLIPEEKANTYKLRIDVMFRNKERDASMTILDIGFPTGFYPVKDDLERLSQGRARLISMYEDNKDLSDRGSIIIYLEKVSHTQPEEISFGVQKNDEVANLQPAAVSVYEYYDKTQCVKFYRPKRGGTLPTLCTSNNECSCVEESCTMQKHGDIENHERLTKACEVSDTSRIDFVYKVRVEDFAERTPTDLYTVQVEKIYKSGTDDPNPMVGNRTLISSQFCRDTLNLRKGSSYLIMGSAREILKVELNVYRYLLGEFTWLEYWPTDDECKTPGSPHEYNCLGLENMDELLRFPCLE